MNAQVPVRAPASTEADLLDAPEWSISPSPFDWQVMIYGGVDRRGFPQQPLEFQFFAGHYSRQRVYQRAADLCEREHRLFFQVREPARLSDEAMLLLGKGQCKFERQERRGGGR